MFQGGMGLKEIVYWSNHGLPSLKEQLRLGVHPIRIDLPGRKLNRNIRPFYTFIGWDAINTLKDWLEVRPNRSRAIFTNQFGDPVSEKSIRNYWTRHLKNLGIIKPPENPSHRTRYGKNPHELRDLFRTRWQKSGASPEVAEFLMGHIVDPLGYNKAMRDHDYVAGEYMKAEPWLNILSEDPSKVPLRDVLAMKRRIEELERETTKIRKLEMLLEDPEVYEAFIETLQRLKERKIGGNDL